MSTCCATPWPSTRSILRRVFRHHGRAGVCVGRCRRQLGAHRPGPAGRAVSRGADAAMIRVVLPAHLRTLAHIEGEVALEVDGRGHPALGPGRARGPLSDAARDDARSRHAEAPAIRKVLRLRGGSLPRTAGLPAARGGALRGPSPFWSWEPLPEVRPRLQSDHQPLTPHPSLLLAA